MNRAARRNFSAARIEYLSVKALRVRDETAMSRSRNAFNTNLEEF